MRFSSLSCSASIEWSLRLKIPLLGRAVSRVSLEPWSTPNRDKIPNFLGLGPSSSSFTSSNPSSGSSTGGIRGDRWSRLIREGGDGRESKLILGGTSRLILDGCTSMLARSRTGRRISKLFREGATSLIGDRAEISNDLLYESNDSLEMVNCSSGGTTAGLFLLDEDEFSRLQKLFFSGGDGGR